MTITLPSTGISASFIAFNSTNMTVGWYTIDNLQAGNYIVKITGTIIAA
jgi:hypothetical protein